MWLCLSQKQETTLVVLVVLAALMVLFNLGNAWSTAGFSLTLDKRYKVVSRFFAPFGIEAKKGPRVQVCLQPPRLSAEGTEASEGGGRRFFCGQEEARQGGDAQVQAWGASPPAAAALSQQPAQAQAWGQTAEEEEAVWGRWGRGSQRKEEGVYRWHSGWCLFLKWFGG